MVSRLRAAAERVWRFLRILWEQVHHDSVLIRASGLAYASLLAFVPLVAVLFALFTAFAAFDDLKLRVQEFLFAQFLPTRQDEIVAYINQFTANTSRLGFIGFLFLIVTAIGLLDAIEKHFNDIWHVGSRRHIVNKITAYTSVLVFGAAFLGASLSITSQLKASAYFQSAVDHTPLGSVGSWVFPLTLTVAGFLFMYLVIPFTRVRFLSALVGALAAGVLWELGKNFFANSVGHSVRYSTIYGSIAIVPIFLVWLYVTWVITLVGAEIAFTHQNLRTLVRRRREAMGTATDRVVMALRVFACTVRRFRDGEEPPTDDELADRLRASPDAVARVAGALMAGGMLRRLEGNGCAGGLVPARDLDRINASDLIRAVLPDAPDDAADTEIACCSDRLLREFQDAGHAAVGGRTIRELLDG